METKAIHTVTFFTIITAIFLVEAGLSYLPGTPLLILALARILQTALILLILHCSAFGPSDIGLSRHMMVSGVFRGLVWSAGFGLMAVISAGILLFFGISPLGLVHANLPDRTWDKVLFFGVGGFLAPVAEEIFFRGVLYGYLRSLLGRVMPKKGAIAGALILSTFIFAASHTGITGILIPQLLGGLVFCIAYEIEKSLLAPMVIHCLGNLALFSLALIA